MYVDLQQVSFCMSHINGTRPQQKRMFMSLIFMLNSPYHKSLFCVGPGTSALYRYLYTYGLPAFDI